MASEAPADRGQLPDCSRVLNRARFSNCHVCDCCWFNVKLKTFQRNPIGHVFVSFTKSLSCPLFRCADDAAVGVDRVARGCRDGPRTPQAGPRRPGGPAVRAHRARRQGQSRPEASHPRLHHVLPPRHGLGADGTQRQRQDQPPDRHRRVRRPVARVRKPPGQRRADPGS